MSQQARFFHLTAVSVEMATLPEHDPNLSAKRSLSKAAKPSKEFWWACLAGYPSRKQPRKDEKYLMARLYTRRGTVCCGPDKKPRNNKKLVYCLPFFRYLLVVLGLLISGKKKAHKLLTYKLFQKRFNPRTTSRLTRRNCFFSWVRRRTHKLSCPVNRPLIPGSTGPSPEQTFMLMCLFLFLLVRMSNFLACPAFQLSRY